REDGKPGAGRAEGGGERRGEVHPGALGLDLQPVAGEHPGLVHLAPAVVGPPDPGLVRRARKDFCRAQRKRSSSKSKAKIPAARSGRPRYVVLLGPGALLLARLAGKDQGPGSVPALLGAGDGQRHHLLLGSAHGDRSEERRVGKECRSRWSRCDKRKKKRGDGRAEA